MSHEIFDGQPTPQDPYLELSKDPEQTILDYLNWEKGESTIVKVDEEPFLQEPRLKLEGDISIGEMEADIKGPRNAGEVLATVGFGLNHQYQSLKGGLRLQNSNFQHHLISKSRAAVLGLSLIIFS